MTDGSADLLREAEKFATRIRKLHSIVYKLAFIATSDDVNAEEAYNYLKKMVEEGIITPSLMNKALEDTRRWRERVLDRKLGLRTGGDGVEQA
ncbi:MAG: hypothetical protein QW320_09745 [Ignisphaera sp.]